MQTKNIFLFDGVRATPLRCFTRGVRATNGVGAMLLGSGFAAWALRAAPAL